MRDYTKLKLGALALMMAASLSGCGDWVRMRSSV